MDVDPPPTLDYKRPEVPPPVTGRERVLIICGYLLIIGGAALVAFAHERMMTRLGIILFLLGGGIAVFSFIYNALRRM